MVKIIGAYRNLDAQHAFRAQKFFKDRALREPHLAWMEKVFLKTLDMVAHNKMLAKVPPDKIQPITLGSPYLGVYENIEGREEHYRELGEKVLQQGSLMAVDLVAGMATGFGGGAKGAVSACVDARYEEKRGVTYLDIKRANYLALQRESGRHLIAAAMVSDETMPSIIKNLKNFAEQRKVELVLIHPGESRERIQKIWNRYKDKWQDSIIVPLIKQPSTLYISEDGKEVGGEYMKGHGDFYDVVQSQLRDLIEIADIRYVFVSNIDNTGALISRSILGYFIEQVEREKIEALVEVAEKYEGDKGGAPALVDGQFSILEKAFVPDEWKEAFLGRETFPFFNTNTFWFQAKALLDREFSLPLMISKIIQENNKNYLKIESIMGHGLEQMVASALLIDRGSRFCPAKFLSDLWIGRTDWMRWYRGKLMPVMRNGKYVPKPLVEVSRSVFRDVEDLNRKLFGHGSYDSMTDLNTLLIGGEGKNFQNVGQFQTNCGVRYIGDVVIIFEYREGRPPGTLIVQGRSAADTITLKNSVIYVPAGEVRILSGPVENRIEADESIVAETLKWATRDLWTESQRERVLKKLFEVMPIPSSTPSLEELVEHPTMLDEVHQEQLRILSKVFIPEGSLVYEVVFENNPSVRQDPEKRAISPDGRWPKLRVTPNSKTGIAVNYPSRVDEDWGWATDHKAQTILHMSHQIFVDPIDESKGAIFKGKHYVAIPYRQSEGGKIFLIIGQFNENYNPKEKTARFPYKLKSLMAHFADPNQDITEDIKARIRELFQEISWADLFELSTQKLFDKYIAGKV